ncbi:hypothetical protein DAEQUDRAFT_759116 [Daedalea quercina L-15889]|uniref:DUF6534 domain-containing protein n=1 Tax=Daedalea quercina L-15889 TaxID=1314783 RepID=A0A165MKS6_9APHY|nr:hypothetical protein DAEQUDRAFT_759116 [Daedalea quercina L-15889]
MPTFPPLILGPPLLGFAFNWALQGIFSIQVCANRSQPRTVLDHIIPHAGPYSGRRAVALRVAHSRIIATPTLLNGDNPRAIDMKRLPYARKDAVLNWGVATEVWLWGSVFVDAMIAGCMIHLLRRFKTLREDTNLLVNRLIRLIAETGCLTAVGAITVLVFYRAFPETLLAACPLLLLSKLYANTLLITLNNRAFMNAHVSGANIGHSPLILHMTSRQTGQNSLAAAADAERPVEVTLPADTESYTAEAAK